MLVALLALSSVAVLAGCGKHDEPVNEIVNTPEVVEVDHSSDEMDVTLEATTGDLIEFAEGMVVVEQPAEVVLVDEVAPVAEDVVSPTVDEVVAQ